ncbi:MAG: PH domain-containing protein [Parcubacteria group bacterium]|nr:PH domain-containing protein [Parcubacteria group bacterium]
MISLAPDEHIVYTARKHPFVFFTETTFIFIFALAPLIFLLGIEGYANSQVFSGIHFIPFMWFLYTLWVSILWLIFAYIWTDYYLDVWIVTNKHLIDVNQQGLFNRKISTSRLDLIQDVTVEVPGILATMLKYGNIRMQTAGKEREFVLNSVAKPYVLKDTILKEQDSLAEKRPPFAESSPSE